MATQRRDRRRQPDAAELRWRTALPRPRRRVGRSAPRDEGHGCSSFRRTRGRSKRFWNETQEAAEDLHYNPVHPLLGQPVNARAPHLGSRVEHGRQPVPRPITGCRELSSCQGRCTSRWPWRRPSKPTGRRPQRGQSGAAPRPHPRRDLRPHPPDHPQRGHAARWSSPRSRPQPTATSSGRSRRPPNSTRFRRPTRGETPRRARGRSPRSTVPSSTPAPEAIGFDYGDAFRSVTA